MLIVLVPGLMNDGWVWRHQIGPLSRIAPVMVSANDRSESLAAMADAILAATTGPIAIVGHSMGGRVALEAAVRAPERVVRLGLLNTGAGGRGETEAEGRLRLVEIARSQGMAAVAREWLPPMVAPHRRGDAALTAGITAMLERADPDIFARQQNALLSRPDRSGDLAAITCPTLVATGSDDGWAPPAQHEALAAALPNARLEIVHGAGHMLPVEAPEKLTSLLVAWASD